MKGMTRLGRLLAIAALLGAGACARKEPSAEFSRASERFNKLYAQHLDDAYLDPGMHEVEGLLQRVPPDSLDAPGAQALLKRIQEGRARMEQAARERAQASAAALAPPTISGATVTSTAPATSPAARPAAPADAGPPSGPHAGMGTREFNRLFGDCFESAGPVEVTGRGTRDSFALADSARCRAAHPTMVNSLVLADSDAVLGVVPKSALQRTLPDGGTPAPPAADAGGGG
jgi:hypothetical protein